MVREASFVKVKVWAKTYLPAENELRDAILGEPDGMSTGEVRIKLDAYSRMLDSKARRIAETE